jgi:hypothetical protein
MISNSIKGVLRITRSRAGQIASSLGSLVLVRWRDTGEFFTDDLCALTPYPLKLLDLDRYSPELIEGRDAFPHQHIPGGVWQMEARNGPCKDFIIAGMRHRLLLSLADGSCVFAGHQQELAMCKTP